MSRRAPAAERIDIDNDTLPAVTGAREAVADGAPLVYPEFGTNVAFTHHRGSKDATDAAFARAARVVRIEVANQRLVANDMETRGADARPATHNVPSTTNAMGIKGAGEAGTIGATPAVMNAVVDALARARGITHVDMPATPERVWAALHAG